MLNDFITPKYQELECRFYAFEVGNHVNCTLRMYKMFP